MFLGMSKICMIILKKCKRDTIIVMCRQLRFLSYSTRNGGNNNRRAKPVSYIIGKNEDRSCAALFRADMRIKFCVVNIFTPDSSFHLNALQSIFDIRFLSM